MKIVIQVKRELDGVERRGKLFLVDLASPEKSLPDTARPVDVEDAKDVAVSLLRLGACVACVALPLVQLHPVV